ncbi:transketolase family protein [Laedolimicola ammoniilytica]|uniref:Transketolase n=1 Tax=Laedolimicola ammoniilytica TaxID=2981771 RepID=A0ABT2RVA0_9FIRM|nr:transketolase C-terminal domain-containing protein [Laedolimicola ammoniilytica]MCU6696187.1 transketolase [Laedolimicola ammoniilytica]SCH49137.1 1-deoxy-D-xylulose-5-phosphate synthase [uncultured Clostridium sp.]SCH95247.1 1-deoxy-D-xylulose-5-phosphate synthase [uncultured Clostridium sp.]
MQYDMITLRELVGKVLVEYGEKNPDICVIDSDLAKSTTTNRFQEAFPERFYELGIAEQNAMSAAAGMAAEGKIPFYVNFAIFVSGTCWTQLRQICYANANVKLIATHPGMDGSYDGATHHADEDLALMRVLPNLKVLVPSNPDELREAVKIALAYNGPVYIRCARDSVPNLPVKQQMKMGKAVVLEDEGNDFAMIYEGSTTDLAMRSFEAYREKGKKGKLINIFSVKPVDRELIRAVAEKVEKIVTIENHSIIGGLGGLVAETICDMPKHAPLARVGVEDVFTESGSLKAVKEKYGLTVENVLKKLEEV